MGLAVRMFFSAHTDSDVIRPSDRHQEEPALCSRAPVNCQPGRRVAEAGRAHSFPSLRRSVNQSVSAGHTKKLRNETDSRGVG